MEPSAFSCPSCAGPIYDDWYPSDFIDDRRHLQAREYWSDNVVTGSRDELRSLVSCPLCFAIFPIYSAKKVLSGPFSNTPLKLDALTPFVQVQLQSGDNSNFQKDSNTIVFQPDERSWLLAAKSGALNQNYDFLFKALIAESIIQTFNDRVRDHIRGGKPAYGALEHDELYGFLANFVREAQDNDNSDMSRSMWAGCDTWEFQGITRLHLLIAEVDRYLGNFDHATERLQMIQTHVIEMEQNLGEEELEEVFGVDYTVEYEDIESLFNWDIDITKVRIEKMLTLTLEEETGLALVHSGASTGLGNDWMFN
jgi:hypothetical protein